MNDIVTFGHPALNMKSENVENIDDYIVSLTKRMIDIMYEAPGVGLAAPQIGINKNLFVFDAGDGPKVAINPKIEDLQGTIVFGFSILTAVLILGSTTDNVFAQDNPSILLKIAERAQDQIQNQISNCLRNKY